MGIGGGRTLSWQLPSRRRSTLAVIALLGAVATVLAGCGDGGDDELSARPPYNGFAWQAPATLPPLTLRDTDGDDFLLTAELDEAKLSLVYLGYTHCPDICPTHMADIAAALRDTPEEIAGDVEVVFITTDPERDSPEVIDRWLANFDDDFVGLTGDQATLDALQISLGLELPRREDIGEGNYTVGHAAFVMAFTPDGIAHLVYPLGLTHAEWTQDIVALVEDGWREDLVDPERRF
jgi:protein SCO1/2